MGAPFIVLNVASTLLAQRATRVDCVRAHSLYCDRSHVAVQALRLHDPVHCLGQFVEVGDLPAGEDAPDLRRKEGEEVCSKECRYSAT